MACDYRDIIDITKRGDFIYLDPPYIDRGARYRGEYGWGTFTSANLDEFASYLHVLDRRGVTFLVSYADVPEFRAVASEWNWRRLIVSRTVASSPVRRTSVAELVVSNRNFLSETEVG
jgi:DNA adenine methylase